MRRENEKTWTLALEPGNPDLRHLNGERAIRTQKGATILKEPCAGGLIPKCFLISIVKKESKTYQENLKIILADTCAGNGGSAGSLASSVTMK